MDRASRKRRALSSARRRWEPASKTINAKKLRIPAQIPRAKGDLAAVHAGQSPMCPIPRGRGISNSSKISSSDKATFINAQDSAPFESSEKRQDGEHRTYPIRSEAPGGTRRIRVPKGDT
jgi:hypothetical protein